MKQDWLATLVGTGNHMLYMTAFQSFSHLILQASQSKPHVSPRVNFRLSMTPTSGPIKTPNSVSSEPGAGHIEYRWANGHYDHLPHLQRNYSTGPRATTVRSAAH